MSAMETPADKKTYVAGKTTTIGMFTTRTVPTRGRAFVYGIDVAAAPAKVRDHIGVVSQGNSLDRSLNAIENLEYHGRYFRISRKEARSRAMTLLERFGLADRAQAQVTALSAGVHRHGDPRPVELPHAFASGDLVGRAS